MIKISKIVPDLEEPRLSLNELAELFEEVGKNESSLYRINYED